MKINLKTKLEAPMTLVYKNMDRKLFEFLLPPGAQVINFDGSQKGNEVRLKLGFPFWAEWISIITEDYESENYCFFIDEGRKLPMGLKKWKHKHWVHQNGEGAIIEDDIYFTTDNKLIDWLLYPFLYLSFLPRVFQYKSYFHSKLKKDLHK